MNKASGGDGILAELFQISKDDAMKSLHSICQQIWKTQQWPQDCKRSVFISIPKKGSAKESSNYHTIAFISHASKVMLKILQARLQQHVNHELPDVQAGFSKGRGTRDQIANIHSIIEKARELQKNIYFYFIDYAKDFGVVNKAEVDVFLELSCFFCDPTNVGNLISCSSTFSKSSLNIQKFMVHILLKPGLENFEHYFTSMRDECNWVVVWAFFGIAFLWDWNENWPFPVLWPLLKP